MCVVHWEPAAWTHLIVAGVGTRCDRRGAVCDRCDEQDVGNRCWLWWGFRCGMCCCCCIFYCKCWEVTKSCSVGETVLGKWQTWSRRKKKHNEISSTYFYINLHVSQFLWLCLSRYNRSFPYKSCSMMKYGKRKLFKKKLAKCESYSRTKDSVPVFCICCYSGNKDTSSL